MDFDLKADLLCSGEHTVHCMHNKIEHLEGLAAGSGSAELGSYRTANYLSLRPRNVVSYKEQSYDRRKIELAATFQAAGRMKIDA